MEREKNERYNELFERMIDAMTTPNHFDRDEFIGILKEIGELFNISKCVTEFYTSLNAEREGKGEILMDYDRGNGDKVVIFRRFVTSSMNVIKSTVYMPSDAEPLSDEEYKKADRILKTMLSFIGRNRLQSAVERLAFYDEDGFPNLNYFTRRLDLMNEKGTLSGNTAIKFNLRQFSLINREIGHDGGDVVIRKYFDLIKGVIGDNGIICRIGGDNFAAIFRNDLLKFVLQITEGFPVVYDESIEKRITVSASVGVFIIPDDFVFNRSGDVLNRIFPAAEEAKLEKNGTVVYYDQKMLEEKEKLMQVRRQFSQSLENGEFFPFYQPKVDINSGRIVGAEALCRWIQEGKILYPPDFVPIMEQNLDICRLDFYMLEAVCKDMRQWIDEGRDVVRVSVNLSRKHLLDTDLIDRLLKIIDKYKIPHEYIEFELAETSTNIGYRKLNSVLKDLRKSGICMTVDDFGIGYSSLNLIRELPWNVLKLDRCLIPIDEKSEHGSTGIMFCHIVSMAQSLGLEVIAEGVETSDQIGILRRNNCNIAQGFLFDKPMPSTEFRKKLKNDFSYPVM